MSAPYSPYLGRTSERSESASSRWSARGFAGSIEQAGGAGHRSGHREAALGTGASRWSQHPSTLVAQTNLANYLDDMGRLAESEAIFRDVIAQSAGQPALTMGLSQPQLKANLASTFGKRGKLTEAKRRFAARSRW